MKRQNDVGFTVGGATCMQRGARVSTWRLALTRWYRSAMGQSVRWRDCCLCEAGLLCLVVSPRCRMCWGCRAGGARSPAAQKCESLRAQKCECLQPIDNQYGDWIRMIPGAC